MGATGRDWRGAAATTSAILAWLACGGRMAGGFAAISTGWRALARVLHDSRRLQMWGGDATLGFVRVVKGGRGVFSRVK